MTPEYTNQLAAQLLLSGLATVLLLGVASWLVVVRTRPLRAKASEPDGEESASSATEAAPYQPSVFEHACRWLAVKSTHLGAVQAALGLHNTQPCSWGEGLSSVAIRKLFVSPPIRGWILVVGQGLPDPAEDVDQCFHLVRKLSRTLGQVQFFSVNRALHHHAWVRADRGRIRRAYAWAGETLWRQGDLTAAERELNLTCLDYGERGVGVELGGNDSPHHNSEKVLALAARWSLDPTAVRQSALHASLGVAGELTRPRAR